MPSFSNNSFSLHLLPLNLSNPNAISLIYLLDRTNTHLEAESYKRVTDENYIRSENKLLGKDYFKGYGIVYLSKNIDFMMKCANFILLSKEKNWSPFIKSRFLFSIVQYYLIRKFQGIQRFREVMKIYRWYKIFRRFEISGTRKISWSSLCGKLASRLRKWSLKLHLDDYGMGIL